MSAHAGVTGEALLGTSRCEQLKRLASLSEPVAAKDGAWSR